MDKEGERRVKKRFGARVRKLRRERRLSQEGLAFDCGLDRSYLGSIERGERNVSLVNIHRIADALQVKAGELFEQN
jgi:transcriptional regulator with XRE-family HTH domain